MNHSERSSLLLVGVAVALLGFTATGGCLGDSAGPPSDEARLSEESENGSAVESADGSSDRAPTFERQPQQRLLAEGSSGGSLLRIGMDGEPVRELPRTGNVVASGTQMIIFAADFDSEMRDLRVGYGIDDEPIAWHEMDPEEPVRVEVGPNKTEADGVSWSFYVDEGEQLPLRSSQARRSWQITVHANGSYPVQSEPLETRTWDQYRDRILEGFEAEAPEVFDLPVESGHARPVVAIVDSGINPFHQTFRNETLESPGTLGVPATAASSGDPARFVGVTPDHHDEAWVESALKSQTLYRFNGTPHYFYSLEENVTTLDRSGHGTAVAGALLGEFPHAAVVNVQTPLPATAEGISWASQQDWIDIITVSRECPHDCVDRYPSYKTGVASTSLPDATRTAWDEGKLVVYAAGNSPTVTGTDPNDGPPWVISVGGADTSRRGTAWGTSKAPDVISDIRVEAPRHDATNGTDDDAGTSYSAPIVSATLAEAIDELREGVSHQGPGDVLVKGDLTFTNRDLRRALNASAIYWEATAFDASGKEVDQSDVAGGMGVPVNPAAPWLQMGWGYANSSIVPGMVEGLLDGELPQKSAEAQAYMESRQDLRRQAWR